MGAAEVSAFLTHLAVDGHVAASTQNQALSALLFLYREVLEKEFGWLDDVVRAKKPKRLPVVFSPEEAMAVIGQLKGARWLMGLQLYGGGLRLMECLRLRVKDLDFERLQVTVREGKGDKDRVTLLPEAIVAPLREHLAHVQQEHERALREGYGGVELPYALARKYPHADREWGWQYVYPAGQPSIDPRSGARRRHHLDPSYLQKAVGAAIRKLGIHVYGYEFKVIITNKSLAAGSVVDYHAGRGSQENTFGELKTHCHMDYVPVRTRMGNATYLLSSLFAFNLIRELQMKVHAPQRSTNRKRTALWAFERVETIRHTILQRAGRLSMPSGRHVLTFCAGNDLKQRVLHILQALAT